MSTFSTRKSPEQVYIRTCNPTTNQTFQIPPGCGGRAAQSTQPTQGVDRPQSPFKIFRGKRLDIHANLALTFSDAQGSSIKFQLDCLPESKIRRVLIENIDIAGCTLPQPTFFVFSLSDHAGRSMINDFQCGRDVNGWPMWIDGAYKTIYQNNLDESAFSDLCLFGNADMNSIAYTSSVPDGYLVTEEAAKVYDWVLNVQHKDLLPDLLTESTYNYQADPKYKRIPEQYYRLTREYLRNYIGKLPTHDLTSVTAELKLAPFGSGNAPKKLPTCGAIHHVSVIIRVVYDDDDDDGEMPCV